MVENLYVAKFIGVTKLFLSLIDKTGIRRLSSYMLIFFTAVPVAFGWILVGAIYTTGFNIQVSGGIVFVSIIMNASPIILYIARTLAPNYSKQKFLQSLGVNITTEQLKEIMKVIDETDEVDIIPRPHITDETLHAEFAVLKTQVNELITLLKKDSPSTP